MIYSPSSTIKFLKCPQEYAFYKQGIVTRALGNIDYGAMFGGAMSEAMDVINTGLDDEMFPLAAAHLHVKKQVELCIANGIQLDYSRVADVDRALQPSIAGYRDAIGPLLASKGWVIKAAEWTVPDSG